MDGTEVERGRTLGQGTVFLVLSKCECTTWAPRWLLARAQGQPIFVDTKWIGLGLEWVRITAKVQQLT